MCTYDAIELEKITHDLVSEWYAPCIVLVTTSNINLLGASLPQKLLEKMGYLKIKIIFLEI